MRNPLLDPAEAPMSARRARRAQAKAAKAAAREAREKESRERQAAIQANHRDARRAREAEPLSTRGVGRVPIALRIPMPAPEVKATPALGIYFPPEAEAPVRANRAQRRAMGQRGGLR